MSELRDAMRVEFEIKDYKFKVHQEIKVECFGKPTDAKIMGTYSIYQILERNFGGEIKIEREVLRKYEVLVSGETSMSYFFESQIEAWNP